ncbi:T9SS type B sorting domain-containing protein [Formosa sediminum]|uniref:T9SS type B sorting domain-containing protein n=1 Tax=Formosa sediminum TaxID=2594004 RepID=A0A516GVM2_9FLAO|nr:gliding motility-associated C-terminal domain-containing protein [Formosa sediminum]QDO95571.1 T9SS type B sorting domain-containing protein [Formosa sediminum]
MKKFYATKFKSYKNIKQYSLLALMLMAFSFYSYGQVIKPFTPRENSTGQSLYTVKGDFTIIGNKNLTTLDPNLSNGEMIYVDVDGDNTTLNSSSATLQLKDDNGAITDCSDIVYAGLYWIGRPGPDDEFTATNGTITKTLNKRQVSISGPSSSSYTTITAASDDIYYPSDIYSDMFIAYSDVTDYVKQNGPGNYDVADIALLEGVGGSIGYFGGWSMVVIYENSTMKSRNISTYDGYAFRRSINDAGFYGSDFLNLDVSNLTPDNSNEVAAQIGVMAAEEDLTLAFDSFILNGTYLSHSGNSETNFFNSSITVGGSPRNPNFADNNGLGLSKFDIPTGVIAPNQSTLNFEYTSIQDKYIIYNLTFSVEAPAPDIEAEVSITDINGVTNTSETTTVEPGQEITYKVDIKNFGTEAATNSILSIPVPFNTTYKDLSISSTAYAPFTSSNAPIYNATTNTIDWDLGDLPEATRTDDLLASFTFKVTATDDCNVLVVACAQSIALNGTITGSGVTSSYFSKNLITGYDTTVGCIGTPIDAPLLTSIVNTNCANTPIVQTFEYCESTIPFTDISSAYPIGTKFYDQYPVSSSTTEFTSTNTFPGTSGVSTYYAIPANTEDCYFEFTINVDAITSIPTVDSEPIEYCLNETATALTATPTNSDYILYYYENNDPNTIGQTNLTPDTSVAGTFTYYVAEGTTDGCLSENKAEITIIVHDVLDITSDIVDATCTPGGDGSIDITVTGGSGNYSYAWSTGATTEDITGLTNGSYTVTITDETTGCDTATSFNVEEDLTIVPIITAPENYELEGCSESSITDLAFSATPVSISLDQLQNAMGGNGTASGFSSLTYSDVVEASTCPVVVTRTFTATNDCNNSVTATQTITIIDTTAPVVPTANIPADVTIECSDPLPAMIDLIAIDECDGNIVASGVDTTDDTDPCNVIVTRTWTFSDNCGNEDSVSQTITIVDTTGPEINASNLLPITVYCNGEEKNDTFQAWLDINGGATATDNCTTSDDIVWTNDYVETDISPCGTDSQTITFTATDACGNTSTVTSEYTFADETGPVIINEAIDLTLECGDQTGLENWLSTNGGATAIDECSEITSWSNDFTAISDECGNTGSATVTFTVTDTCGNPTTTTATVTIVDTTAPEAPSAPADITVECIEDVPTATTLSTIDECSGEIIATAVDTTNSNDNCDIVITRTWTFTDDCGNSNAVSQIITVKDETAPVVPNAPEDITIECLTDLPALIDLTATDNCTGDIIASGVDTINDTDPCNIIVTRTWTFTDNCGNTDAVTQIITVKDETAPVLPNTPADISVSCISDIPAPTELSAIDNCGGTITAMSVDSELPLDSCNTIITRTWTFADACGNTSTTSQTITVNDDIAPTITVEPIDIVDPCTGNERSATIDAWLAINGGARATDNCSTVTWTNDYQEDSVTCNGPTKVIFTATDECGNSTSVSATYTIEDFSGPNITTEAQDISIECGDINSPELLNWLSNNGGAIAQDICSETSWSNDFDANTFIGGNTVVTFTASDQCGNINTTTANIIFTDSVAPIAPEAPADITVECTDIPEMIDLTATDNCEGTITATGVDTINDTDPCNILITRTWTFTDASGNSASTSQTITVIDTTAPIVPTVPADVTVECSDELPVMVNLTATDSCAGEITASPIETIDNTNTCEIIITRTWTFEDNCGNVSEASQTITVVDSTAPVITNEAVDIISQCDGLERTATIDAWIAINGGARAVDNCSEITWTNNYDPTIETCSGPIEVTFTATDSCGNSTSTSATYLVDDQTGPTIDTEPQDLVLECASDTDAIQNWLTTNGGAIAFDYCSDTITWTNDFDTSSINNDVCGEDNAVTVTFTIVDNCGNETQTTATITIIDETAPVAPNNVPADVTVACYNDIPEMTSLTATDECAGDITVTGVDTENDTDPTNIIITRTWTFSDACGNTTEVSQTISVKDEIAPVVDSTLPTDLAVECLSDVPAMEALTATDNCVGTITSEGTEIINDTDPCNVIITRTWTFTDTSANTTEVNQTITVKDETAPVVSTLPTDMNLECDVDIPTIEPLTAIDNCAGELTSEGTETINTTDPLNTIITRTWTFSDACGNTTEVSQTITVKDVTAPIVDSMPTDTTYACIDDVPELTALTATDNCSGTLSSEGTETIDNSDACNVTITRTWMFTDASGNETEVTQTITVIDDVAPTAPTAPADLAVQCIDDVPVTIDLTATDNCGESITSTGVDTVTTIDSCSSIITRTWSFTDSCGNTSTATQIITVEDTIAPTLITDLDTEIEIFCSDIPEQPELDFTDNCSANLDVEFTEVSTSTGAAFENYQIIRDWTVTDTCGNAAIFTQTITVNVQQDVVYITDDRCTEGGSVDLNNYLVDPSTNGTWVVESGDASLNGSIYDPINSTVGASYVFTFTEAEGCQNQTTVTIDVNEDCVEPTCDPIISTTVTPNGDQWNEYFTVTGLDRCGFVIDIEIYNRWGALVYKAQDYQNNWNGKNNKGAFGNADNLPTGTYYYIVTLKNSGLKPLTGPIYLGTK